MRTPDLLDQAAGSIRAMLAALGDRAYSRMRILVTRAALEELRRSCWLDDDPVGAERDDWLPGQAGTLYGVPVFPREIAVPLKVQVMQEGVPLNYGLVDYEVPQRSPREDGQDERFGSKRERRASMSTNSAAPAGTTVPTRAAPVIGFALAHIDLSALPMGHRYGENPGDCGEYGRCLENLAAGGWSWVHPYRLPSGGHIFALKVVMP